MLLTLGLAIGGSGGPQVSLLVAFALIASVGALGVLESRRLNEYRFYANLGVAPITVTSLVALPALIGEIVIATAFWR